jgi:hypothetical protein
MKSNFFTFSTIMLFINTLITIFITITILQILIALYMFFQSKEVVLDFLSQKYIHIVVDNGQKLELGFTPNLLFAPIISLVLIYPLYCISKKLKKYA